MEKIEIFDSTLRDGAQGQSVNFSIQDKMNIMKALDDFGVDYIEAGNPCSNQTDLEFFRLVSTIKLKNSEIVAFGATRHKKILVENDEFIKILGGLDVKTIAIFGKSWDLHVQEILGTTLEENLAMIRDTIEYLVKCGKTVFFDSEHFFDGYKYNPDYAIKVIQTAANAGASKIILCDTNGGCFPDEIFEITEIALKSVEIPIGIHCHNDTSCAVANSIFAVKAGALQVQGTFIGFGERSGNTNLSSLIPSLQLKRGYFLSSQNNLHNLTKTARCIAEISNITLSENKPYVGKSAFAHKGGMHVDGVFKNPHSFEHIDPFDVGNKRNILLSEVSGRTVVLSKLHEIAPELTKQSVEVIELVNILKEKEYNGFLFEAAEASFELLIRKYLGKMTNFFDIVYFKVIGEKSGIMQNPSSAIVKVTVSGKTEITAAEGEGPVNAIDKALRQVLTIFYPEIGNIRLVDYKVRVMDSNAATAAVVRVLIESTDGQDVWTTVGASSDIINASVMALVDSIEYKLMKDRM